LQLYTVREETQTDMLGTLRRLAALGFKNLEFAGYGNATPRDIRRTLDDLGLRAVAAHVGLAQFEAGSGVFDELHTLGCRYAVVPYTPAERRETADQVRRLAGQFNTWAAQARAAGLGFAYHNHDFEFAPLDGSDFFSILLDAADPDLVKLELDLCWAQYAGQDPVALIRRHAGRVPLLHMKDLTAGEPGEVAIVGEGILPWDAIIAAAAYAGAEWYVIEHDNPPDPLPDVERALRYLEARAA
jgi:sugar phosphate isomerase/epimerase